MTRILSQAEIDALLASVPSTDAPPSDNATVSGPVIAYDFRRPDRISKDQIRSLHLLHDRFARNVTSSLSAYLRTSIEVSVATVEQFSYSEFLMSLPDPTAFYSLRIKTIEPLGALELNPGLAFTMVDRMLGGTGRGAAPDRALTEIEQNVVDSVVKLILGHLTETWQAVTAVGFTIDGRETRPQMLPIAGRNEIMLLLGFDMKVGEVRGLLHVCLPAAAVEVEGLTFSQGWQQSAPNATVVQRAHLVESLGRVPMDVSTLLDSRMRVRDVLELSRGDVIGLGVPLDERVRVRVGDRVKYVGRLTSRDGRAAVAVDARVALTAATQEAAR
ncbi:MAG: flagellar motor switch protein FliM [Acidobacteria bacterium]|nr:flagellar motor switch protein FliM [Acidobacteriota bacterium]